MSKKKIKSVGEVISLLDSPVGKLEKMFELQRDFQDTITPNFSINNQSEVKTQVLALFSELNEVLNETPWKPWKKKEKLNIEQYKEELIDVLHFFINLCLLADISAQELYDKFLHKNTINRLRQVNDY